MNEVNRCPKRDIESAISLDDIIVEPRYVRWISFHMSSGEKFQRDNRIEKKEKYPKIDLDQSDCSICRENSHFL